MYKKHIIILFIIAIFTSLNAAHINWQSDYEKSLHQAKKESKDLMIFLRKKDCTECQKMLETTLLHKSYIKEINDNFVSVLVTYGGKMNYPIELFYTQTFPAIFFVSSKDEMFLIDPIFGYISDKSFEKNIVSLKLNK